MALPDKLPNFSRAEFEDTCKRRFFFGMSFDCYGGVGGLYDFGPVGCSMKANFLALWRRHFVLEENMLEVDTTCLTPEEVFQTSGHTQRFTDVMVKDMSTGKLLRADKHIEEWVERKLTDKESKKLTEEQRKELLKLQATADGMPPKQMAEEMAKWSIKSMEGNDLSAPENFNLMFPAPLGPAGDRQAFLRPELAQGIMLNFNRLLEFNGGRMPFAGAAIGSAFRNEIAPRNNLLRVREFTLAEIEHFVNPEDKSHPKFKTVADLEVWLWPRSLQEPELKEPVVMKLGEAVESKMIDNETLGYFMGRVALFLKEIGMRYVRFRQHRAKEMAHYAQDCWDAECLSSFGWVECVGIADRSCYDLSCHAAARKTPFLAYERFDPPRQETVLDRKVDKGLINKTFKRDAKPVLDYLNDTLSEADALELEKKLAADGSVEIVVPEGPTVTLERKMASFAYAEKKIDGRNYTPSVIEPSFGVGRLLYTLLEQVYWVRRDEAAAAAAAAAEEEADGKKKKKKAPAADDKNEKRAVYSLPAQICPYKCSILPLSPTVFRTKFCQDYILELRAKMVPLGITNRVDDGSQTIGKKYARSDEIGVPFGITIDPDTESSGVVTLRERDSSEQVLVPVAAIVDVVQALCVQQKTWEGVKKEFPVKTN